MLSMGAMLLTFLLLHLCNPSAWNTFAWHKTGSQWLYVESNWFVLKPSDLEVEFCSSRQWTGLLDWEGLSLSHQPAGQEMDRRRQDPASWISQLQLAPSSQSLQSHKHYTNMVCLTCSALTSAERHGAPEWRDAVTRLKCFLSVLEKDFARSRVERNTADFRHLLEMIFILFFLIFIFYLFF